MLNIVQSQLAIDLNCTIDDLNGEKDKIIFVEARDNPGRRPFPRGKQCFDMFTMEKSIIVSATPARLAYAKKQLSGKDRNQAFSMPFVRGYSMFYLPDIVNMKHISPPNGFSYQTYEKDMISPLLEIKGFTHSLQYNKDYPNKFLRGKPRSIKCEGQNLDSEAPQGAGNWPVEIKKGFYARRIWNRREQGTVVLRSRVCYLLL